MITQQEHNDMPSSTPNNLGAQDNRRFQVTCWHCNTRNDFYTVQIRCPSCGDCVLYSDGSQQRDIQHIEPVTSTSSTDTLGSGGHFQWQASQEQWTIAPPIPTYQPYQGLAGGSGSVAPSHTILRVDCLNCSHNQIYLEGQSSQTCRQCGLAWTPLSQDLRREDGSFIYPQNIRIDRAPTGQQVVDKKDIARVLHEVFDFYFQSNRTKDLEDEVIKKLEQFSEVEKFIESYFEIPKE